MAEYINRTEFLEQYRSLYCSDCDGRKNEKGKIVYEIGDAPCRACDTGDMLDAVEDFPAANLQQTCNHVATNADVIRSMTDEELADFIARQRFSAVNPIAEKLGIDVTMAFVVGRKNVLDWLQSPAGEVKT